MSLDRLELGLNWSELAQIGLKRLGPELYKHGLDWP